MLNRQRILRIKSLMVAIISAIMMLVLVSTISFDVFAESDVSKVLASMNISSSSYVVMSGSTSEVVIDQHGERKMQPGSIAMLVNAMVVLDKMYDDNELENVVDITEKLAEYGDTYKEGESVKVGDLLNAMLIGGDRQSAEALAKYSASKRSIFVNEMNAKCAELRIMDTEFSNPSGFYSTKQYSTALDCAVIMQAAVRYQKIKDAFAENKTSVTAFTKDDSRQIHFAASNPLINGTEEVYKDGKGGIEGYLGDPVFASQYAGAAVKDDMQLIVVLMDSAEKRVGGEARSLLDYASTLATRKEIVDGGKVAGYAMVRGGEKIRVPAYTESKGFAYVPPEGSDALIDTETVIFKQLEAPLEKGAKVGEFRIYVADELKGTVDLITKEKITKGWPPSLIYISNTASIVLGVVLALILLVALRILYVRRKRRKMRELKRRLQIREMAIQQMEIDEDRKRRNWTYGGSYDKFAPRTADIRKEALEQALKDEEQSLID